MVPQRIKSLARDWDRRVGGDDECAIPAEIQSRLLAPLFTGRDSIVNGGLAGFFVGSIVAYSTSATWVMWWLVAHTSVFLSRLIHLAMFNAQKNGDPIAEAPRFAIGGFCSALLWGVLGGLSLFLLDNAILQAAVVITASGVAGGTASRNAGYPALAKAQVAVTLILTGVGGLARGEPVYLFIAMLCFLHVGSLVSLVTRLHADELALLVTARERAAMAEAFACQNERFEAALENMSHGLCMFDLSQRAVVCNRRFAELLGQDRPDDLLGRTAEDLFRTYDWDINKTESVNGRTGLVTGRAELQVTGSNGSTISILSNPMPSGGTVMVCADITERRRAEARLAFLATHDPLTRLPNRVAFIQAIEQACSKPRTTRKSIAVLCLDLDRFKAVNDTLGHPAGDKLLGAVAERLGETVGASGLVARFGGDEFSVFLDRACRSTAIKAAERIIHSLSEPYLIDEQQVLIGASVGIALAQASGSDPERLMKRADLALYNAKSDGKGTWRVYDPGMMAKAQARRELEIQLRAALSAGELELRYQPCLNLASGEVVGCEALLRWRHPSKGLVMPEEFIKLAEEVGLIVPIGDWVLREACANAAKWTHPLRVAVNVSPIQFRAKTVVSGVLSALATSGLAPDRLELEITEGALIEDQQTTLQALTQLRRLGVRIAMDDFGTGFSSLSYLHAFPFDRIKIDGLFVREVGQQAETAAIVRAVTALGSNLQIAVTAEGVETEEQFDFVRAEGCAEAQGNLISPPLDLAELGSYLAHKAYELPDAA